MKRQEIIKLFKGKRNTVFRIMYINIGVKLWDNNPYMIIEDDETWEDVHKDNFNPIVYFKTQKEIIDYIYNYLKK